MLGMKCWFALENNRHTQKHILPADLSMQLLSNLVYVYTEHVYNALLSNLLSNTGVLLKVS